MAQGQANILIPAPSDRFPMGLCFLCTEYSNSSLLPPPSGMATKNLVSKLALGPLFSLTIEDPGFRRATGV